MTSGFDFGLGDLFAEHEGNAERPAEAFTILVVCTGNVCRSPLADQLLRERLRSQGIAARVHSAGTGALVGESMTDQASALSRHYGGEPSAHRARQITETMVREADLVLTASREHRTAVVSDYPQALKYTFTLNQLARILASLTSDDLVEVSALRELVAIAAARRGIAIPPENPDDDDIVDPYRRSQSVYDASGAAIDRAVAVIVSAFARVAGE